MASSESGNGSPSRHETARLSVSHPDEESIFESLPARQLGAFGRKVTATAGQLISGDAGLNHHYENALGELRKELGRPMVQRSVWSLARSSPTDFVRSKLSVPEIQHRALSYLPDDLLSNVPPANNPYSLYQGFQATLPEDEKTSRHKHGRRHSRGRQLITEGQGSSKPGSSVSHLKSEQQSLGHRLERISIRKNMCSSEIREIDNKIFNLNNMRKIVLERLAGLEQEEADVEHELIEVDSKLEEMQDEWEEMAAQTPRTPTTVAQENSEDSSPKFMSESIFEKLSSPRTKRQKLTRRRSMAILHEHMEPGSRIKELQAHNDVITALDFDAPFGTGVTAALDDTVRVWDLNAGRCIGLLEGHLSSVRCVQMEDNIVATGSMDATIRLWDLSRAQYAPQDNLINKDDGAVDEGAEGQLTENPDDAPPPPPASNLEDCHIFTLESHVAEVTALHLRGDTLISGSADKTLRQWDLEKGRCVQTLDVLWAAAQAAATMGSEDAQWRQTGRLPDASADFVGALQSFEAALACGTADGLVRLWDLRSGQVHRSLIGHTGPITSLQFDDVHLVTGSLDRSIRIWDLRTGSIYDAFAFENPITSMMFDVRRIVAAAGENVVKVYDKVDGTQWDCGPGTLDEDNSTGPISVIEKVRIKDGYMIEGRRDGMMGVWAC